MIRKGADGWEWTRSDLGTFAEQARAFAPAIKAHLNFTVSEEVTGVQIVHQLLSQIEVKVAFRWSTKTKAFPGEKVRVYSLKSEHWEILKRRAEQRESLTISVIGIWD